MSRPGKMVLFTLVFSVAFFGVPSLASADALGSINQTIGLFNAKDSHGVTVSQFQLSMASGNPITSPQLMPLAVVMGLTWSCYAWWVAMVGWVADWTMQMDWVGYLAEPLASASQRIHDSVLAPLGLTSLAGQSVMGLLLAIAALSGAVRIHRGQGVAAGVMSWAASGLAAALAVGTFALPMASLVGTNAGLAKPLVYARSLSIEMAAIVEDKPLDLYSPNVDTLEPGKTAPKTDTSVHLLQQVPDNLKVSTMLVDMLVRPAHQELNYGANIDAAECTDGSSATDAYDTALEKGPYWSITPDQQRKDIGGCNADWKKYADNPNWTWLATAAIYCLAGVVLGALVMWFIYVVCRSVLTFMWAAFKLTYLCLSAIVSPAAWTGVIDAALDGVVSLWMLVSNLVVFCIVLMATHATLTTTKLDVPVRFMAADIVILTGIGLLTVNYLQTLRGKQSLFERIKGRFGMAEKHKINWSELSRDAALGYTAYSEFQEKKALMQGKTEVLGEDGQKTQLTAGQKAAVHSGKAVRGAKGTAGAIAAPAATAGRAALTAAKDKAVDLKDEYQAVTDGAEVTGAKKAMLPIARAHNTLRTKRNQLLIKGSEGRVALEQQHDAARNNTTNVSLPSSGSSRLDRLAINLGQGRAKIDRATESATDVVNGTRHPNQRGQQANTTGRERLDKVLKVTGTAMRGVDKGVDAYNRPASVQPSTPRVPASQLRANRAARAADSGSTPVQPPVGGASGATHATARRATPSQQVKSQARRHLEMLREQRAQQRAQRDQDRELAANGARERS